MGTDFDAFLSYSKHDQTWVETHLIPRLQAAGITYLDYQQFQLGAPKLNEIERAVISSRKTLLVISPEYLASNWQGFESVLASSFAWSTGQWSTISVRIVACNLPLALDALPRVDLYSPQEQDLERLIDLLRPKPDEEPAPVRLPRPTIFEGVPAMPRHFVGRNEMVDSLIRTMTSGKTTALATDGMGGVGKTALAIAIARHPAIWARFPNGVLWAGLGQQANVMSALAFWGEALGLDVSDKYEVQDRRIALQNRIGSRRMLLVIDDVWELEAAEAMQCGGENCCYLLTTRDKQLATRFAGRAQIASVLPLTDEAAWNLLRTLAPEACAADPDAARALAYAVGGLPLAVELLGGYLVAQEGTLFPDLFPDLTHEALAELTDPHRRLQLATQRLGSRGGKLTFEQILSLSLEDLPEEVQKAFYALGAFAPKPATFSREAAEAVAETDGKTIALLATRNLVEVVERRFALHQTLADLAREKMLPEVQLCHRVFYLGYVNKDVNAWENIETEYRQITWGFEKNQDDASLLEWLWGTRLYQDRQGLWQEKIKWSERGLNVAKLLQLREEEAILLNNLGQVYDHLGKKESAFFYYERSLQIRKEINDLIGVAISLINIGGYFQSIGDWKQALENFEQALPILQASGNQSLLASVLNNIGGVHDNLGDIKRALDYYKLSLQIHQALNSSVGIAAAQNNIGKAYFSLGQPNQAMPYLEIALAISEKLGDKMGIAGALNNIGLVFCQLRQPEKALTCFRRSQSILEELHALPRLAAVLNNIGEVLSDLRKWDEAFPYLEEAYQIREEVKDRSGLAVTLNNIGLIYHNLGQLDKAMENYLRSLPIRQEVGDNYGESITRYNIARIYRVKGNLQEATKELRKSVLISRQLNSPTTERFENDLAQFEAELAAQ